MGVIAPGRYADFLLLKDLEHVAIESVFFGGEKIAEHGKALFSFTPVKRGSAASIHSSSREFRRGGYLSGLFFSSD